MGMIKRIQGEYAVRCVETSQVSVWALLFLALLSPRAIAEEDLVPLEIDYPKICSPSLIPQLDSGRVHLDPAAPLVPVQPTPPWVPKGTGLLSKGKPVSSSDESPIIGELPVVTDGAKEEGDAFYVEIGPGLQYVQIDLERVCRIYVVALWHYIQEHRVYHDVVVQISNDGTFREGVTTVFNNDHDNSAGLGRGDDYEYRDSRYGRLIEVAGIPGRYVRLYSNGSTGSEGSHTIEVEVYGLTTE